jgi:hypothetical protein
MAKKQTIERRAFSQSRAAEYLRLETLQKMTGRGFTDFPRVVVKELLDNALDAAETAGIAPQIRVVPSSGWAAYRPPRWIPFPRGRRRVAGRQGRNRTRPDVPGRHPHALPGYRASYGAASSSLALIHRST